MLVLSIKYAFGIISMFFTLVRCSIVLLMFLLTYCIHVSYLMSKFIAFLNVFSCPTRNVPYGKSCLLWNLGLSHFFFVWYRILFKYIMFDSKCPKWHSRFFSFFQIFLVSTIWQSLSCQVSQFFSYHTNPLIILLFWLQMFVMSYHFFCQIVWSICLETL